MKTLYTIALVSFCFVTGNIVAVGAPANKPASTTMTPLTFANAVSFFKAAKFQQPKCNRAASSSSKGNGKTETFTIIA